MITRARGKPQFTPRANSWDVCSWRRQKASHVAPVSDTSRIPAPRFLPTQTWAKRRRGGRRQRNAAYFRPRPCPPLRPVSTRPYSATCCSHLPKPMTASPRSICSGRKEALLFVLSNTPVTATHKAITCSHFSRKHHTKGTVEARLLKVRQHESCLS